KISSTEPTTQFNSRGRRKAPVKKTRSMCTDAAATKMRADQWWTWRMNSPPRISNEISRVDAYAADISMPYKGLYAPSYTTWAIEGSKKNVKNVPERTRMTNE